MKNTFCPNFSDPKVKQEFDELVDAVGENAAYYLWDQNNGYSLDYAPNGAQSKLFSDLLEYYNGNRKQAIIAKASTFSKEFKNDFINLHEIYRDLYGKNNVYGSIVTELLDNFISPDYVKSISYSLSSGSYNPITKNLILAVDSSAESKNKINTHELVHVATSLYAVAYEKYKGIYKDVYYNTSAIDQVLKSNNIVLTEGQINSFDILADIKDKATNYILNNQQFVDKINKKYPTGTATYFLTEPNKYSLHEFISEIFTNPQLMEILKNIPYDTKNTKETLFSKFIELISKIFNLDNNALGRSFEEVISIFKEFKQKQNYKMFDDNGELTIQNVINVNQKINFSEIEDFTFFHRNIQGTRDVLQQQLEQLNQSYQINTKEKIDEQLSKLRKSLSGSMEIKLNTLDIVDLDDKAEAEANIKYLISQLNDENVNDLYAIFQFTRLVNNDLPKIAQEILDAYNNQKVLSDDRILSLDRNFFGFYSPMMQEISDIIDDLSKFDTIKNTDVFQNLRDLTITVQNVLQLSRNHLRQMQTENFKRIMIESNIDSSNQIWLSTINEFVNGDVLNTNRDITQLTRLFMSPDKVKDPAMKTLYKLLQDSQNKRRQRVFNKSVIINKLSENIKGGLLQFYETDKNGKPTGYLIRNRKYGLFNNDVANFMQQLRIKFGMKPSDLNLPEDPILRAQFAKLKNQFLSHRAERKYTTEFYEIMDSLSAEAQAARDQIDSKIRLLKDKYRDNSGYIDESKMNNEDRDKLQTLEIQKKLLKCRYYTDGTPKTGIDLQIAEDLQRVSKILGEDYITVKDTARFEKIRKQKQQELTEEEYNKWYESNTKLQYTEEFRKELEKLDKTRYGEEYIRLQNIRNEILAPYRDSRTNEILASKIPANTKYYLDRLERLMSNERKKHKGKKVDTSGLFKMVPTQEYFDLRDKAMQEAVVNGSFDEMIFETIFYMQTSHRTNAGWQPNSYYLKLVPANDKYIERVPNDNFNVLSSESKFYNKNFDHTSNEYYQPKAFATEDFIDENGKQIRKGDVLYDNSQQFKKVMQNKENRDFYNELVSTMKEANDYYYNRKFNNNYMLPQIEGSIYRYMKYKGLLKGFASKILSGFVKTNEDTQMKEKAVQSPDKQKLNLIPQYYTKRLEDPSIISADLIGIIMEYYDAAVNFDEKTKIKAKVETIKSVLGRRTYTKTSRFSKKKQEVEGVQTQIYKMADTFTDMQLYDRMNSLIKVELFGKEFNITKLVNTFRTIGTYVNLAGNWAVAATGGITGAYQMLVQTIVGRYYDWDDTRRALTFFVTDSFWSGIRNIGNRNYKSKQLALMDEAEIGSELRSRWQNSNHYGPLMTILRKLGFWGMSVVDYCVKGQILDAVMYNFKYVNGEFICKEDYLDKYGNTESTRHKWRSFESAMDCIEFKNGKLQTKDPSKQESWKKAKFKIYNTARALSASADGQLTTLQKAQFTQNAFGGLAMMHRQYIPVVLSERYFMSYQYDPNLDRYREAVVSTIWRYIQKVYQDRNVYGLLNSAIRNYKEFNRDNATRASIKQGITELTLLLGVLPQITSFMLANADENDDSWWAKFLAYIAMRVEFESKSPYNLLDIVNTIKNPTPLFGLIDNFKASLVSSTKQLFDFLGWTTSEDDNIVSRGAYKDWNKTQKNLFKLTPLKNPYEQYMDIDSKIRYYKTQIMNEDN